VTDTSGQAYLCVWGRPGKPAAEVPYGLLRHFPAAVTVRPSGLTALPSSSTRAGSGRRSGLDRQRLDLGAQPQPEGHVAVAGALVVMVMMVAVPAVVAVVVVAVSGG
jgi:hypothetical protein